MFNGYATRPRLGWFRLVGKIGVNIFFGLSVVGWIFGYFCMMDERSNICLFIFFSSLLPLPFYVFVVHIGVSFVPGSCRVYSIGRKTRNY